MTSQLFLYAESIFKNRNVLLYIISNISYCILKNISYKTMYFEGDLNSINNFISIIKHISEIKTYKEYLRYGISTQTKIIIIEEDDNPYFIDEKYCKIFINRFNKVKYLTNSESVIIFQKEKGTFNLNDITKEFLNLETKYTNYSIRQNNSEILYEELVLGEKYNLILYDKFIEKNIINKDINSFSLDYICNNINYSGFISINNIKEYLLQLFGKPNKPNIWDDIKIKNN